MKRKYPVFMMGMIGVLFLLILTACGMGRYYISPFDVFKIILSRIIFIPETWDPQATGIVLTLRLPRIITAVLVGSAMAFIWSSISGGV